MLRLRLVDVVRQELVGRAVHRILEEARLGIEVLVGVDVVVTVHHDALPLATATEVVGRVGLVRIVVAQQRGVTIERSTCSDENEVPIGLPVPLLQATCRPAA